MTAKTALLQTNKLSETLNELMESYNLSVNELSQKTGLAATTIKRIKNDTMCNPTLDSLMQLAQFFSLSVDELLGNKTDFLDGVRIARVPLLEWQEVKPFLTQVSGAKNKEYTVCTYTDSVVSNSAFALRLNSVAMEPLFYEGTIVLFDPSLKPANRDCILLLSKGETEPLFRQWLVDGPNNYFRAVNPEIIGGRTIFFDKNLHEVIAVMVETCKKYR